MYLASSQMHLQICLSIIPPHLSLKFNSESVQVEISKFLGILHYLLDSTLLHVAAEEEL